MPPLTKSDNDGTYVHWLVALAVVVICLWFAPEIRRALGMKEGLDVSPYGYNNMAPAVSLQRNSQIGLGAAGFLGYPQPPVFNGNTDWAATNNLLAQTVADRAGDDATGKEVHYSSKEGLEPERLGAALIGA